MENMEKNENQEVKETESSETSTNKGTSPIVLGALVIGVIGIVVFGFLTMMNLSKTPGKQPTSPVETSTETSVSENDTVSEDEVIAEPVYSSENPEEWTKEDWDKYNAAIQAAESSETLYYDANTGKLVTLEEYNKTHEDGTPIEVTPIQDEDGNKTIKEEENGTGYQQSSDGQPIGSDDTGSTGNSSNNNNNKNEESTTPATCLHKNTYDEKLETGRNNIVASGNCYTQLYTTYTRCSDCGELINTSSSSQDFHNTYETTEEESTVKATPSGWTLTVVEITYKCCECGAIKEEISRTVIKDNEPTEAPNIP